MEPVAPPIDPSSELSSGPAPAAESAAAPESAAPKAAPSAHPSSKSPARRLRGMTLPETVEFLAEGDFPAFRAKQLFHWVYRKGIRSLDEATNLPKAMREWVAERAVLGGVEPVEAQGTPGKTRKAVWRLADGRHIESVVMRDEGKDRTSLCLSSQVGCAVGCTFCLTGYGGFQRHCTPDEIVAQVLLARRDLMAPEEPVHTIVFMGMGEPMLNLDAVVKSIGLIGHPDGVAISPRRITVSTSGVVPGIDAFGAAATGANLAVSLNATTDEGREAIMPLNRKWPIAALMESLERFPLTPRQRITIEYVLLRGVNDSPADARRLAKLLRGSRYKVNLIMFNPHELLDFAPADAETLDMFMKTLADAHLTASVRWSKGREIEAACGQLAAHHFRERATA